MGWVGWVLVDPLSLAVGLTVTSRRETDINLKGRAEMFPHMECDLGSSVGNNISGDAMQTENMINQQVFSFPG